mmetsp:Transcript_21977/g.56110  ORF Transcript_21977/g.56110 Transcript_21977/m.56110 type:complete len:449 (+) Transcript_21977:37-1383(+)
MLSRYTVGPDEASAILRSPAAIDSLVNELAGPYQTPEGFDGAACAAALLAVFPAATTAAECVQEAQEMQSVPWADMVQHILRDVAELGRSTQPVSHLSNVREFWVSTVALRLQVAMRDKSTIGDLAQKLCREYGVGTSVSLTLSVQGGPPLPAWKPLGELWHVDNIDCAVGKAWLVTGASDKLITIWDMELGEPRTTMYGHVSRVTAVTFIPTALLSGSADGEVRVWDLDTEESTTTFHGHSCDVTCLADMGGKVVSGSLDHSLYVWDADGVGSQLLGHQSGVAGLAVDGQCIYSAGWDDIIIQWSQSTLEEVKRFVGHEAAVSAVRVSHTSLFSGSCDGTARRWCLTTGEEQIVFAGHDDAVWCLALGATELFTGSFDMSVRVWNIGDGRCIAVLDDHSSPVWTLCLSSTHVFSSGNDGRVNMWNMSSWKKDKVFVSDRSVSAVCVC